MSKDLALALQNSECLFDEEAIDDAVEGIAAEIRADYEGGERPVYLTLMRSSTIPPASQPRATTCCRSWPTWP